MSEPIPAYIVSSLEFGKQNIVWIQEEIQHCLRNGTPPILLAKTPQLEIIKIYPDMPPETITLAQFVQEILARVSKE